jgi:voltage-gated potassium channel
MSSPIRSLQEPGDTPAPRNFRQTVQFYMVDFQTPLGKAIDILLITLNLLYVALFIINTYPISIGIRFLLWRVELVVVAIFIVEYILRLYGAPDRWAFVKDFYSIIDVVSIMPTLILLVIPASFFLHDIRFIQSIRALSLLRIFRFLRFIAEDHLLFGIINLQMLNVARLVMIIIIIFFVYSGLFYFVESPVNPEIQNFGNAFYFTVVAVSTVGFGDIVPVSESGRLVTIAMIVSGIILIPFQAARIFREWLSVSEKKRLPCPYCGLDRHDLDAHYCKRCGGEIQRKEVES